jgi:hypothetical protein
VFRLRRQPPAGRLAIWSGRDCVDDRGDQALAAGQGVFHQTITTNDTGDSKNYEAIVVPIADPQ